MEVCRCDLHLPSNYTIALKIISVKQICMIHYYPIIDSDDINESSSYCPPVWDDFLCWPRTRSGEDVSLNCPMNVKGLDPKRKFFGLTMHLSFTSIIKHRSRKKINNRIYFTNTEFVTRQCLEDGNWFSCTFHEGPLIDESYNSSSEMQDIVGWTNYR